MWQSLERAYEKNTMSSIIYLLRKLYGSRLTDNMTCRDHIANILEIREELRYKAEEIRDRQIVGLIISSLPESFFPLATAIEGRNDGDITLEYVINKDIDEDERRQEFESASDGTMKSRKMSKKRIICYNCQKEGHIKYKCPLLK